MKYNISVLIPANNDLLEICDNMLTFGENPTNILIKSFYKFLDNVSNMPYMYPQYSRKPEYRKAALAYDYFAFYKIIKKRKIIEVYHILNSKQNIAGLL